MSTTDTAQQPRDLAQQSAGGRAPAEIMLMIADVLLKDMRKRPTESSSALRQVGVACSLVSRSWLVCGQKLLYDGVTALLDVGKGATRLTSELKRQHELGKALARNGLGQLSLVRSLKLELQYQTTKERLGSTGPLVPPFKRSARALKVLVGVSQSLRELSLQPGDVDGLLAVVSLAQKPVKFPSLEKMSISFGGTVVLTNAAVLSRFSKLSRLKLRCAPVKTQVQWAPQHRLQRLKTLDLIGPTPAPALAALRSSMSTLRTLYIRFSPHLWSAILSPSPSPLIFRQLASTLSAGSHERLTSLTIYAAVFLDEGVHARDAAQAIAALVAALPRLTFFAITVNRMSLAPVMAALPGTMRTLIVALDTGAFSGLFGGALALGERLSEVDAWLARGASRLAKLELKDDDHALDDVDENEFYDEEMDELAEVLINIRDTCVSRNIALKTAPSLDQCLYEYSRPDFDTDFEDEDLLEYGPLG